MTEESFRQLFEIDTKDYDINGTSFSRPSARGIIIKDGKFAMIHSKKCGYYKFPGGGIEENEDKEQALIREVLEETGLSVIPKTIRKYGMVHRIQKGDYEDVFIQDNYYYFCEVDTTVTPQVLDDYEKDECFTLEYVTPTTVLTENAKCSHPQADQIMIAREKRIIEMLQQENYIK